MILKYARVNCTILFVGGGSLSLNPPCFPTATPVVWRVRFSAKRDPQLPCMSVADPPTRHSRRASRMNPASQKRPTRHQDLSHLYPYQSSLKTQLQFLINPSNNAGGIKSRHQIDTRAPRRRQLFVTNGSDSDTARGRSTRPGWPQHQLRGRRPHLILLRSQPVPKN